MEHNANVLLSKEAFSDCGNSERCSDERIQIFETTSNPLLRSLKYEQIGNRSDGMKLIEFKSIEIYGTLIFDSKCLKTRKLSNTQTFPFCFIFLVFS